MKISDYKPKTIQIFKIVFIVFCAIVESFQLGIIFIDMGDECKAYDSLDSLSFFLRFIFDASLEVLIILISIFVLTKTNKKIKAEALKGNVSPTMGK